jgi:hypothetical protein
MAAVDRIRIWTFWVNLGAVHTMKYSARGTCGAILFAACVARMLCARSRETSNLNKIEVVPFRLPQWCAALKLRGEPMRKARSLRKQASFEPQSKPPDGTVPTEGD